MNREKQTNRDLRRARTRTLVQIGGLCAKSGLLHEFGIKLGADLQKDLDMQKPVAALYWGLMELKALVNSDDFSLTLWIAKGQKALGDKSQWDVLFGFLTILTYKNKVACVVQSY